jgi:hypothetical protein
MTVFFLNANRKEIHVFSDFGDGWLIDPKGIDKCSLCGVKAKSPRIVKDTYRLRTRSRAYRMCREV